MSQYLLSTYCNSKPEGQAHKSMTPEQMQQAMQKIGALEAEMKSSGAWFFSGRLHDPDTATMVQVSGDEVLNTDGPFAESKEHIAGFYIIEAADLDAALGWAAKVTRCIGQPIEVRPFWNPNGG